MWNNHNLCRDIFCGKFTEQKHPQLRCTTEFTLAIWDSVKWRTHVGQEFSETRFVHFFFLPNHGPKRRFSTDFGVPTFQTNQFQAANRPGAPSCSVRAVGMACLGFRSSSPLWWLRKSHCNSHFLIFFRKTDEGTFSDRCPLLSCWRNLKWVGSGLWFEPSCSPNPFKDIAKRLKCG